MRAKRALCQIYQMPHAFGLVFPIPVALASALAYEICLSLSKVMANEIETLTQTNKTCSDSWDVGCF